MLTAAFAGEVRAVVTLPALPRLRPGLWLPRGISEGFGFHPSVKAPTYVRTMSGRGIPRLAPLRRATFFQSRGIRGGFGQWRLRPFIRSLAPSFRARDCRFLRGLLLGLGARGAAATVSSVRAYVRTNVRPYFSSCSLLFTASASFVPSGRAQSGGFASR